MFQAKLLVQILAFPILVNCSVTNFQIAKKWSYADLDYKITAGFEISDCRFRQRFQDFSKYFNQKHMRFQGVSSPSVENPEERELRLEY